MSLSEKLVSHGCMYKWYFAIPKSEVGLFPVQHGSMREDLEKEILFQLGSNLHPAMRGPTAALQYFSSLVRSALPLLLPADTSESR